MCSSRFGVRSSFLCLQTFWVTTWTEIKVCWKRESVHTPTHTPCKHTHTCTHLCEKRKETLFQSCRCLFFCFVLVLISMFNNVCSFLHKGKEIPLLVPQWGYFKNWRLKCFVPPAWSSFKFWIASLISVFAENWTQRKNDPNVLKLLNKPKLSFLHHQA